MNTSAATANPLLRQMSGRRARLSDPHRTVEDWRPSSWRLSPAWERDRHRRRRRSQSPGLRALISRQGSATSRHTVMKSPGCRMLEQPLFSPCQPQRLLHPPELSLPREPCCPGTRRFSCSVLDTCDAYLVIRAKLARLARKVGRVGSFIFVSRACRARVAYPVHDSRTTNDETSLRKHPE